MQSPSNVHKMSQYHLCSQGYFLQFKQDNNINNNVVVICTYIYYTEVFFSHKFRYCYFAEVSFMHCILLTGHRLKLS